MYSASSTERDLLGPARPSCEMKGNNFIPMTSCILTLGLPKLAKQRIVARSHFTSHYTARHRHHGLDRQTLGFWANTRVVAAPGIHRPFPDLRVPALPSLLWDQPFFAIPSLRFIMGRDCADCDLWCERGDFSSNQWRKGPGSSRCVLQSDVPCALAKMKKATPQFK